MRKMFIRIGHPNYDLNDLELVVATAAELQKHSDVKEVEYYEEGIYTYVNLRDFLNKYNGLKFFSTLQKIENIDPELLAINTHVVKCEVDDTGIIYESPAAELISVVVTACEDIGCKEGIVPFYATTKYNQFLVPNIIYDENELPICYNVNMAGTCDYIKVSYNKVSVFTSTEEALCNLWDELINVFKKLSLKRCILNVPNEYYPYRSTYLDRITDAWEYVDSKTKNNLEANTTLYQWYNPDGYIFYNGRAFKCKECKKWYLLTVSEYKNLIVRDWNTPSTCKECKMHAKNNKILSTIDFSSEIE